MVSKWAPGYSGPQDALATAHVAGPATGMRQLLAPSTPLPSVQATHDALAHGYLPLVPSAQGKVGTPLQVTHAEEELLPGGEYGVLLGQLMQTLGADDPVVVEYVPAGHGRS